MDRPGFASASFMFRQGFSRFVHWYGLFQVQANAGSRFYAGVGLNLVLMSWARMLTVGIVLCFVVRPVGS